VVQRIGGYEGYGADNAPVRLAVQSRLDAREGPSRTVREGSARFPVPPRAGP
jgi:hypothetical protein